MSLNSLNMFLADAAPAAAARKTAPAWTGMVPIVLMVVALYFVLFHTQSKKAKQQAAMLKTIKPGDKIVASNGIVGTVVSVKERTLALRSAETKLEILRSAVSEITERAGETSIVES